MNGKYILVDKKPVKELDLISWAKWFESANRHVAKDKIKSVRISTVFLGLDHCYTNGQPILFETMVFGGKHDQWQDRYSTWEEAEIGHKKAVQMVKGD